MSKKRKNSGHKVGFWEMIRDVLITSLNKGQFPIALVAGILMLCIAKMPPADVSKFAFEVLKELKEYHLIGDLLSVVLVLAWFLHSRFQRKFHLDEIKRVTDERNKLQGEKSGVKLQSSKDKE